jgi:hypothetical protein
MASILATTPDDATPHEHHEPTGDPTMEPANRASFDDCESKLEKHERSLSQDEPFRGRFATITRGPSARFAASLTMVFAMACQTIGGTARPSRFGYEASGAPTRAPKSDRVSGADLRSLGDLSLDQALRRLRPNFLRVNPSGSARPESADFATIYIDNSYAGTPDMLRLVPVAAVEEVSYLTPSAAHDRFGAYCPCSAGVIVVNTRRSK